MTLTPLVRPVLGAASILLVLALARPPVREAGSGAASDARANAATALGAVGAGAIGRAHPAAPSVFAWVADHDGDRVALLDEDLIEVVAADLACPTRVEARRDGAAWVVSSKGCGLTGRRDLWLVRPNGAAARRLSTGPVRDLASLDGGDALVLEGDWASAPTRVVRVTAQGAAREVASASDATCVAGSGDRLLLGTRAGACLVFDADVVLGPVLARRDLGVELSAVAPAAGGGWWVLGGASGSRLWRLGPDLSTRFVRDLGGTVELLASAPEHAGAQRAFLPRSSSNWVAVVGEDGRAPFDLDLTGIGTAGRGDGLEDGGVLFTLGGALVRVDGRGDVALLQGGFDWLTDASAVPRP